MLKKHHSQSLLSLQKEKQREEVKRTALLKRLLKTPCPDITEEQAQASGLCASGMLFK